MKPVESFDITIDGRTYRASAPSRRHGLTVSLVLLAEGGAVAFADRVNLDKVGDRDQWAAGAGVPVADLDVVRETLLDALAADLPLLGGGRGPSQATQLVDLAKTAGVALWHDADGEAYATVPVGDHREHWRLRSKPFREFLARLHYTKQEAAVGSQALQDALNALAGEARFAGAEYPVHVRLAGHEERIYLDLGDDCWRAVEISAAGWAVVGADAVPVRFRRPKGLLPLPAPARVGNLDGFRALLNLPADDDFRLVLAWLVAALRPTGPFPVLSLSGEQGSAKSTTGRLLRRLIDPNKALLRSAPREERDLALAATNSLVVGFDNLSFIPDWLSDALCRVATGGGFGTRTLYENDEESLFDFTQPVVFTAIAEAAVRGDLLDRALAVALPPVATRRTEKDIEAAFLTVWPGTLGVLLDAVATAIRNVPTTRLDKLPRMADFALWAEAAAPAFGWAPGDFVAAYQANRETANAVALEASPLAAVLVAFVENQPLGTWQGTASDLLFALNTKADAAVQSQKGWPKAAHTLSGQLKRLAPNLRKAGIEVETGIRATVAEAKHGTERHVRITRPHTPHHPSEKVRNEATGATERPEEAENRADKPIAPVASPSAERPEERPEATGTVDDAERSPTAAAPVASERPEDARSDREATGKNGLDTPLSGEPVAPVAPVAPSPTSSDGGVWCENCGGPTATPWRYLDCEPHHTGGRANPFATGSAS